MSALDAHGGWPGVLGHLVEGGLDPGGAASALGEVLAGNASPAQTAALLVGLRCNGETPAQVAAMVEVMLGSAMPLMLESPEHVLDLVGTGGSPMMRGGAFNVSTMASIVVAATGVKVCKHGNRKASSSSGSTDLLESLDVEVELDGPGVAACVRDAGVGFAFARMFHPAMRHAAPVRAELGIPTVFNLLGPLSNPARVGMQVVGVADAARIDLVAGAIAERGTVHSWVVHGHGGLDELTTTGTSTIVEVIDHSEVRRFEMTPEELGLERAPVEAISVGDPSENAAAARALFEGDTDGAVADMVALNAAAGLVVAGSAGDLPEGIAMARGALADGAAARTLGRLVAVSRAVVAAESGDS
ncbi:MAG: anthranilate phosphoribosyltransferase [Microthrixaceae bacterium]